MKYVTSISEYLHLLKVSEYPFKQCKNMLKNIKALLSTYFCNIFLNELRPDFFNIYNLTFSLIGKKGVKVGPKTNHFPYFMSSSVYRITICNNLFALICNQSRDKKAVSAIFFLRYFLNNLLLTAFMHNTFSKLVELL